ncbi:Ubiquitin domain [Phytophthora cinnamomi]|uniref:Ubiquitin domain n=1 Tax=Phytophthora cinnamomi TaxID=4785 RepID=UPI003559B2A3|nr:Ubiquitin domain [Phytophthora cinnamomi]
MSSDEEEEVKLYSALERNKKRQMFVSLSSSSDEDGDGDESFDDFAILETPTKKRRQSASPGKAAAKKGKSPAKAVRALSVDSDEDDDDLYTPREREAERLRKLKMEKEIRKKLEKDKVLNQTRAILNKVSTTKRQTTVNNLEVISLDSESDDDGGAGSPSEVEVVAPPPPPQSVVDKGPRITLHIRSNGGAVDEIGIHKKETFDQLYMSFCEIHGLPRSAVKMSLDGEPLSLSGTPESEDLDSGDLIEAKVDFSKQTASKKKTYLRLRLVVFGKRSEVFKIDSSATVEKLHASYCKRHGITNPDDVAMSLQDQELRLEECLHHYGLIDHDEISVKVNSVLPSPAKPHTIALQLRFAEGDPQTHHIIPTSKVQVLMAKIAEEKSCESSSVSLMIDGEEMAASQSFKDYDLEGGELIEVKIAS